MLVLFLYFKLDFIVCKDITFLLGSVDYGPCYVIGSAYSCVVLIKLEANPDVVHFLHSAYADPRDSYVERIYWPIFSFS